MIPRRYTTVLFSLILAGMMSFLVSGIATVRATGLVDNLPDLWISTWLTSWLVAFPAVMVVAPLARKAVEVLVKKD